MTIPEMTSIGVPFARATIAPAATDDDVIRYDLLTGSSNSATFEIDSRTGYISLRETVDYESGAILFPVSVGVVVVHRRSSNSPLTAASLPVVSARSDVIIHVTDVNDNAPFVRIVDACAGCRQFVTIIDENLSPEVLVAAVEATDADGSHVTCALQQTTTVETTMAAVVGEFPFAVRRASSSTLFDVDATSSKKNDLRFEIVTTSALDRERRDSYDATLICRDTANNADIDDTMTSSSPVFIRVLVGDVNDNRPRLINTMTSSFVELRVVENNVVGQRLTTINASDSDVGRNAALRFTATMTSPQPEEAEVALAMSVDPSSGVVRAEISFDYESARREYEMTVSVCDRGVTSLCLESDVIVHVIVVDENDERPTFERQTGYRFGVVENKPEGTRVGHVSAVDADASPRYRRMVYRLGVASSEFDLDSVSGELRTLRPLDRELESMYLLSTCVYDLERSALYQCVNTTINVEDVNDNAPVVYDRQRIKLSSDSAPGTVVTRIAATDADVGLNARLLYTLMTSSDDDRRLFDLDPTSGTLTLVDSLPVTSSSRFYTLDVAVSDCGQPPLTSLVQLTVQLVAPSAAAAQTTGTGSDVSTTTLLLSVFGAALGVTLILSIVAIILVRTRACRRCRSKMASEGEVTLDDQALAALYNDLSRSLDLVAKTTLSRSRDLTRSAATLTGGGVMGGVNRSTSSMWFSSPDCSVMTTPATPTTSAIYNCQSLGPSRACRRHRSRANDVIARPTHCCHHGSRDVTHSMAQYSHWQAQDHAAQLPARLNRLSSEDDDVIDDSMTSELTSECTDSGRGQSARLSS